MGMGKSLGLAQKIGLRDRKGAKKDGGVGFGGEGKCGFCDGAKSGLQGIDLGG